jgi:signal transduction histidine kinase
MSSTSLRAALRLWRLSALRQAVLLTAAFLAILVGAAVFSVIEVRDAMDRRVDDRLEARFAAASQSIADSGFDPAQTRGSSLEQVIFLPESRRDDALFGRRGTFYEANLVPRQHRGPPEPWLFFGGPVAGGWLIVGQNVGELSVFDEVLIDTFTGIGWATLAVAVLMGLGLGWRTQRRLSEITSVLGRAAEGDLTARVAPRRNRDDLDHLGQQIDETIARIQTALEQAKGFSANIAHDLKTPLTRLRIRLESALMAEADREDDIGAALEETDRAIAIFDAFLRLSRLESGALERRIEPVDLAALARDIAETYAPVIEDSDRVLRTEIAPITMQGDKVLLSQLMTNLIQNALRHTPEGSILTLVARDGAFGLMDDGPGIPEAERERVLEPLYRLDRSRGTEGAGLGLALARTIAARHGGWLGLSEAPGGGLFARMVWGRASERTKLTEL